MRWTIIFGLLITACGPSDPPVEEPRIFTHEAHGGLDCFTCHVMHGEPSGESLLILNFNCGNCHEE